MRRHAARLCEGRFKDAPQLGAALRKLAEDHPAVGRAMWIETLKAMGATRSRFEAVFSALHAIDQNTLRPSRSAAELQSFFESMSFNKARVLVTYWDWAMARTGPYAALTV